MHVYKDDIKLCMVLGDGVLTTLEFMYFKHTRIYLVLGFCLKLWDPVVNLYSLIYNSAMDTRNKVLYVS